MLRRYPCTPARTVRRSSATSTRFLDMIVSRDVRGVTRAMIALAVAPPGGGGGPEGPSGHDGSGGGGGAGNNQSGSSFYGPASHQGVGAGGRQLNVVAGYPSSIGSASTLGPGLSLGYSAHGAGRQGDGGLLPEALK